MLKIYKASAGSGKTYTLVKEYLLLAFKRTLANGNPAHGKAYRHILAITFTNKAANEMKSRIIESLEGISTGAEKQQEILQAIATATQQTEEDVKAYARVVLNDMLHHYADISVCTIDSFVHRIVRAFAYELRLPMNFGIEMDSKALLQQAVELLLERIDETENPVTQAVIEFAESRMDEGKDWNIDFELKKLGEELFKDDAQPFLQVLNELPLESLRAIRESIQKHKALVHSQLKQLAEKAIYTIHTNQLSADDFYQKRKGIYNYFEKIREGDIPEDMAGNSYVYKTIYEDNWGKQVPVSLQQELKSLYQHIQQLWEQQGKDFYLCDLLLKNFHAFILLTDLQKLMDEIKKTGNVVHISDFQQKIFNLIRFQDAPIIYERIGDWYDNILIDEFQDTSLLQWRNLLPLVENAQFKNEVSLIVGDAKQAIYRFRGGEAEQFASLPDVYGSEQDDILKNRERAIKNYGAEVLTLDKNYRSLKEIISFNNALYKTVLESEQLINKSLYADFYQHQGRERNGGYVQIDFLDADASGFESLQEHREHHVYELITQTLARGYALRDIAILTRSNKTAAAISSFLIHKGVKVISPESLWIHHSPKVKLLLACLRYLQDADSILYRAELMHFVCTYKGVPVSYQKAELQGHFAAFEKNICTRTQIQFNSNQLPLGRIDETILELINILSIDASDPFVQFFLDEVILYSKKYGNRMNEFLTWWDNVKESRSIIYPENMDAVRIMTIHKSKGLQFPVVIVADANNKVRNGKEYHWLRLSESRWLNELPVGVVRMNKTMLQTEFALHYQHETEQSFLDMLNLLYVATTRPEEELYLISESLDKEPNSHDSTTSLLIHFLKTTGQWQGFTSYTFGLPMKRSATNSSPIGQSIQKLVPPAADITKQPRLAIKNRKAELLQTEAFEKQKYGNWIHECLKAIYTLQDVEPAVHRLALRYTLDEDARSAIQNAIRSIVALPELKHCFDVNAIIINERAIAKKENALRIPDRITIYEGQMTILDYKTGKERKEYTAQMQEYCKLLAEAGHFIANAFIIYLHNNKLVRVL